MTPVLLGDDPNAIATALLGALREGAKEEDLAGAVTYAAALRIARFHTSNEFGDWDTAPLAQWRDLAGGYACARRTAVVLVANSLQCIT